MVLRPGSIVVAVITAAGCFAAPPPLRFGGLDAETRPLAIEDTTVRRVLDNDLAVALAPDPRTNLVTVDVRYRVGAAEDPPGRGGLAHLVEHVTFAARATPGGPSLADQLGERALVWNAWTSPDLTHFTATVRPEALDALLALEAGRMAAPCAGVDDAAFLRERAVVLAEVAERDDALGPLRAELAAAIYGAGHPYARQDAGEIAAATRAEACAFAEAHYVPRRAAVVVSGAIDVAAAGASVERAFGAVAARPDAGRAELEAPALRGARTRHRAPIRHATAIVFFARPAWGAPDAPAADRAEAMLADALAEADDAHGWIRATAIDHAGGRAAPAVAVVVAVEDAARLDDAVALVHASIAAIGRGDPDGLVRLRAARGRGTLALLAGWDDVASRGHRVADDLAAARASFPARDVEAIAAVDLPRLQAALAALAPERSHVALIEPSPAPPRADRASAAPRAAHDQAPWQSPVDEREAFRPLDAAPTGHADRTLRYQLANGLEVVLAPDAHSPIVDARLVFPAGVAHEDPRRRGVATMAARLLAPDLRRRFTRRELALLTWGVARGTELGTLADDTATIFAARGLAVYADWHVWRLAWTIEQGTYAWDAIEHARAEIRERAADVDRADRLRDAAETRVRARLFGAGHPFARSGTDADALLAISRDDLERWRATHYRARGATLIVSGGFDPDAMRREIDALFAPWPATPGGAPAGPALPPIAPAPGPSWLAVSDEARVRPRLTIAFAAASRPVVDQAARAVLVAMLQDRAWAVRAGMGASYGITVGYRHGGGGHALAIAGSVDPDRAGDVLVRLLADVAAVRDGDGTTADFVRARRRVLARALARGGGATATAELLQRLAIEGQSVERLDRLAIEVAALTPAQVAAVARADLAHARMVVEVAGPARVVDATFAKVGTAPE